MKKLPLILALASAMAPARADHGTPKTLDTIVIHGARPTSLPTQIPTTIEGITAKQLEERINAIDSEDALKYFPSLNVRKRYTGDYDHAVLASRASGTGNSARSLVYADGILLSNLLGNGANFTPRWGMVSPEEIERVDVLYGPFSAAYPGNSVGAVVDFQTRMPDKFEAHAKLGMATQKFNQYGSSGERHGVGQGSASIGNRTGKWRWWIDAARLDSDGQPIGFANRLVSATVAGTGGVPVTGAILGKNPANKDWLILGSTGQSHTVQDHAKIKLSYAFTPTLRASYTLGLWANDAERGAASYLRDAAGNTVATASAVIIDGRRYELKASDFAPTIGKLEHLMHGFSLKQHTRGVWDWEVAASQFDYRKDLVRTPTVRVASIASPGAGNLTDNSGSGWTTLALKGIWRPGSKHVADLGAEVQRAQLHTRVSASSDWIGGVPMAPVSSFDGATSLHSLYAQDTWRFAPQWKSTLGMRFERWQAYDGKLSGLPFGARSESAWSPKAALAWQLDPHWTVKTSLGRAVRNPTAAELFQGSIVDGKIVNSNPALRAERSWTGELTAERMWAEGVVRFTLFQETTRDALYSQPLTTTVNTVQNVGRIRTRGLETAWQADDWLLPGLSLAASATYADSIIVENAALPASVGKRQPRVPNWRANLVATYHLGEQWTSTVGVRYSGRQYGTLDNSDPNGSTYTGVSSYLVADVRLRYKLNKNWSGAVGVDNVNNAKYWAFHPYSQRSLTAELRCDWR
jgi:iron complex outermembrane recepter protein